MNCLICKRRIPLQLKFYELFLLSNLTSSLCEKCEENFHKISENHCPRCWKEGTVEICQDCRDWESQGVIVSHRAVFNYDAAMKEYFSSYKFVGDFQLCQIFAYYFKPEKNDKNFVVVPIPISEKRMQERGFNQVTGFLNAAKIPYQNLLLKSDAVKQSSLSREERLASQNSFAAAEKIKIPEKVLLIDDIYTTGATLQHAAETLSASGVKEIRTFSLCR